MCQRIKPKSTDIPYWVAIDSIRTYMLLLKQASLSTDLLTHDTAHQYLPRMSEEYKTAEVYLVIMENRGPIEGTFPVTMLPPAYSKCQNEEDVRQLNWDYQQTLIYGDGVTLGAMLNPT